MSALQEQTEFRIGEKRVESKMSDNEKKLGLHSVVSVSVGLVIATSCLVSLGQGAGSVGTIFIVAMIVACLLNMTTIASLSELNALMPNTTGGLAQYTLACMGPFPTLISMVGGYLICNIMSSGVEASIFAYAMATTIPLPIPSIVWTLIMTAIVTIANLYGVDMFAKLQDVVAFLLVGSMVVLGLIGMFKLGTGQVVSQPCILVIYRSRVRHSGFQKRKKCKAKRAAWYDHWTGTDLCGSGNYGTRIPQLHAME